MRDPYGIILVNLLLTGLLGLGLLIFKLKFPKRKINLPLLLVIISILPVLSIFRFGTYESGDLTNHVVILQSFYANLKDGILIPLWAGDLCAGHGCPVFLYLYTLPFYLGAIFHFLGFSFLNSTKLTLALPYILSGVTMYFFVKDEAGEKAGFIAALLYLFAPVRFIQMHFVASVGSSTVYAFIPLAFLFAKKSLEGKLSYITLYAVNFVFLVLSHSSAAIIVVPLSIAFAFIKQRKIFQMVYPIIGVLLGIGLCAFYIFPIVFELKYTWFGASFSNISDFRPLFDYFYSYAGFGLLFQDHYGKSILFIGYAQLFIVIYAFYVIFKNKFERRDKSIILFFLFIFLLLFTFLQSFTAVIWNNIYFLKSFQASGRLFAEIAFIVAFLGGVLLKKLENKILILFSILVVISTILNWQNRKMVPFDENAYSSHQYGNNVYTEYFEPNNPIYELRYKERNPQVGKLLQEKPSPHLEILSGKGNVREIKRTEIDHRYLIKAETNLRLSESTYYFPGWTVQANNKQLALDIQNPERFGTLTFSLPKGSYVIDVKFEDTNIRRAGKYISFLSILILTVALLNKWKFKLKQKTKR